MVKKPTDYVPERGDVVWLTLDPASGHEQKGRRPALVISPKAYNQKTGLALCCPITNKTKGYPFEVALPANFKEVTGFILADQLKNLDWQGRRASLIGRVPVGIVSAAQELIATLVG